MMKSVSRVLLVAISVCACGDDGPVAPEVVGENETAVLPLGDSRVQGARPEFESYRYELWKNLIEAEYEVNLIGPLEDPADYPEFLGRAFDRNHGGIGGDRTTDVLDRLDLTLAAATVPPDVVLLGIGGNDLLEGAAPRDVVPRVEQIIAGVRRANPAVFVIVEQIAPARTDSEEYALQPAFEDYNTRIAALASDQVRVVDMTSGWIDAYLADPVHYSEAGAKVVADRYFAAIESLLAD